MVTGPGEAGITLPINGDSFVDFRLWKSVVLPSASLNGAQSLRPFGLRPICLLSCA